MIRCSQSKTCLIRTQQEDLFCKRNNSNLYTLHSIYIHTTQFTAALHTLIAVNYTKQNQLLRSTSTEKNVPHVKILTNSPVPLHQLGNSKKQLAAKKN